MKKRLLSLLLIGAGLYAESIAQRVAILPTDQSPQSNYALKALTKALQARSYTVGHGQATAKYTIRLAPNKQEIGHEAYAITKQGGQLTVTGGDARGLIYGCLSLVEDLQNGIKLEKVSPRSEKPHLPLRAIKFDLPWDTYRHSYALDLHYETCRDTLYWRAFLDMMVANRFNALSLWNLHPYPFMIKPTNFPAATPFNDQQMREWQTLFRAIFRMAKERAIDTYLIPFNIFTSPEFSKAYNVNPALNNLEHRHFIDGDTSAIVKRYTRECVTQVLREYPDLTGFGLTLGEGMGGMTPQQREDWMKATIILKKQPGNV